MGSVPLNAGTNPFHLATPPFNPPCQSLLQLPATVLASMHALIPLPETLGLLDTFHSLQLHTQASLLSRHL